MSPQEEYTYLKHRIADQIKAGNLSLADVEEHMRNNLSLVALQRAVSRRVLDGELSIEAVKKCLLNRS